MVQKKCNITMKKEKELLIFSNTNFPYKISFNLNTGEYQKISDKGVKTIKNVNPFFANVYYGDIINEEQFPIYSKMIDMAAREGCYLSNMGTVLGYLRKHLCWEQYFVLNIPIDINVTFPLTYFPRDILKILQRAISLSVTLREECKYSWRQRYALPEKIDRSLKRESDLFFNCIRYCGQFNDDREFAQNFSFFYGRWNEFQILVENYHYEYKTLFKYLCFLQDYEGYDYYGDIMNELSDYTKMSVQLARLYDENCKFEKYPHFLASKHRIVSANYNAVKKTMEEKLFAQQYDGSLAYAYGKYCIIEPQKTTDILKEAQQMHNCVASYIERVVEGRTHIVFMRERANIDDSLVTVEVKEGHIRQAYQICNTTITEEQREFLRKYAKNKNLVLDNV